MSGRSSKRQTNSNKTDLGGSHPLEFKPEHRQFLVRSLDRNDVDLAALTKVNQSLRSSKAQILESCGELVLLDMGEGLLTLVNDELHFETKKRKDGETTSTEGEQQEYTLTPAQKQMCIDFLWRMQLRRRLANRLVRRLNRIAQAMDGSDVSPPLPPRYGDLRLHIDREEVKTHAELWERQAAAKKRIQQLKAMPPEAGAPMTMATAAAVKNDVDNAEVEPIANSSVTAENASADAPGSVEGTANETTKEETKEDAESATPMDVDPSAAVSDPKASMSIDTPTNPAEEPAEEPSKKDPEPVASTDATDKQKDEAKPSSSSPPSLQDEYELLREYNEAYEKVWDNAAKQFTYVLSKAPPVLPDFMSIKAGAAIGAQTRLLTEKERSQEHKRWQTALLARNPQQPTFEELGLKHRVFYPEERRKRCLEDNDYDDEVGGTQVKKHKTEETGIGKRQSKETAAEKTEDGNDKEKKEESKDDDDSSDMFEDEDGDDNDDDADNEQKQAKQKSSKGKDSEDDSSDMFGGDDGDEDSDDADKVEDESKKTTEKKPEEETKKIKLEPRKKKEEVSKEETQEEAVMEEPKRIRPMSLAAVPSFYEQDLNRIRAVHGDLMSSSILERAQRQMSEATDEYNKAFRLSNQLYDHRARLQQNLAYFHARSKSELAKANNDYTVQVAVAKQRWVKQKLEHDKKRAQQFLPSNWGRHPFGTNATQNHQRRGGVEGVIGSTMADIVDGAIIMLEGKIPNKKFDAFVPPAQPHTDKQTGETMVQQHQRMENELKRQLQDCNTKLQASEEERQRAWTKMMKTKAEVEPSSNPAGRRGRIDMSNYHLIPLPQLRNSGTQQVPRELVNRTAVASYVPPKAPAPSSVAASDSKYSAARVRDRISSDGTVAPVSEPKLTKEGLYVRPAGRTRKGMQWDAVRGIWVPEGSQ